MMNNSTRSSGQHLGSTPAKRLLVIAVAASLPLFAAPASADELGDLKAQIQTLSNRINQLEAQKSGAPAVSGNAGNAPGVAVVAPTPDMSTDVSGSPISTAVNPVSLYTGANSSLKMYGLVEATISRANNQATGNATATGFQTAWFSGNRLGFDMEHGLTDLGNSLGLPGLKVISKLEAEFELPTGNMDTENDPRLHQQLG